MNTNIRFLRIRFYIIAYNGHIPSRLDCSEHLSKLLSKYTHCGSDRSIVQAYDKRAIHMPIGANYWLFTIYYRAFIKTLL